jgi:HK97 gp10 family phage protein
MSGGKITGLPELSRNLQALAKMIDQDAVETGLLKIGSELRANVAARAPRGKTGNLKKGFRSKKFRNKIKGNPATFVAADYRIASHAHLVEFGHGGPHPAPPHPFFRPAMDEFKTGYESKVENMLRGIFDNWVMPQHVNAEFGAPTFAQIAESM